MCNVVFLIEEDGEGEVSRCLRPPPDPSLAALTLGYLGVRTSLEIRGGGGRRMEPPLVGLEQLFFIFSAPFFKWDGCEETPGPFHLEHPLPAVSVLKACCSAQRKSH